MQKIKTALIISLLAFTVGSTKAQNLHVGSSIISLGFNGCIYTFASTNSCAATTASGSLPCFVISPSYSYTVLNKLTLDGSLGIGIYGGGTGFDIGAGISYHLLFPAHNANPFEAFFKFQVGFTTLSMVNGIVTDAGKFTSDGIFYVPGIGIRKYFFGDIGLFADVNYAIYNYNGGEVIENSSLKLPYVLTFSGFNFGGGICWRISPPRQGTSTTF